MLAAVCSVTLYMLGLIARDPECGWRNPGVTSTCVGILERMQIPGKKVYEK